MAHFIPEFTLHTVMDGFFPLTSSKSQQLSNPMQPKVIAAIFQLQFIGVNLFN